MTLRARLVISFIALAVTWSLAFNLDTLPFFPMVVAGGVLTGLFGLWCRGGTPASGHALVLPGIAVTPRQALLAVGVALVHFALGHLLFRLGAAVLPAIGTSAQVVYERTGAAPIAWQLVLSGLVTGPLEEVFWRGALQPALAERVEDRLPRSVQPLVRVVAVVAAATALYTIFHIATFKLALVAAAALGGIVWGWLLVHTRSLGAVMIAHGLWTALMVLMPVV